MLQKDVPLAAGATAQPVILKTRRVFCHQSF